MLDQPTGSVVKSDLQQLAQESDRIFFDLVLVPLPAFVTFRQGYCFLYKDSRFRNGKYFRRVAEQG